MNENLKLSWTALIHRLVRKEPLATTDSTEVFRAFASGEFPEWDAAVFLTALRMKGETGDEIAAAVRVMQERMLPLRCPSGPLLDTCGTGGDESGTFNISTASALVVSACGQAVVKHGNRAVSSRSGSSDVLKELGVPVEAGAEWAADCLERIGFAFCFAPHYHPAMGHIAALRRRLGFRTIFNLLGPLLNPARAEYQLIGIGRPDLLEPMADAVARLDRRRVILVCSRAGLDEVDLAAPTDVRIVRGDRIEAAVWSAGDFGLPTVPHAELCAVDAKESAAIIERILSGADGGPRQIVLANAAAALFAAERVRSLREGVDAARTAVDSGNARDTLQMLRGSPR